MKERNINRVLVVFCIVLALMGFTFWPFFYKGFFYQMLALHFIFSYVTAYRMARHVGDRDRFAAKGLLIGLLLSFNNLLDEAFFEPTKIQINEIVAGYVLLFIMCLPYKVWKK